jgi:hypothetical protein
MKVVIDKKRHQEWRVAVWLRNRSGITGLQAIRIGVYRLSAVILRLRRAGLRIETEMIAAKRSDGRGGTAYARYRLLK